MRTEPTAPNRQNVRDAWLQAHRDHAPDAVGQCGHAVRRVRAGHPGGGATPAAQKDQENLVHIRPYVVSRRAVIWRATDEV